MNCLCQQQAFSESLGNPIAAPGVSSAPSIIGSLPQDRCHLLNSNGSNPVCASALLPKQVAIGPQLLSGAATGVLPQVEQLGTTQSAVSDFATLLAPFSGREYSTYEGANDPQNNLLFGVNIDSSTFMLQHGISNLRNIGTENHPLSMPFTTSTFTSATGSEIPLASDMTASSCVDESGFLQPSENVDQANPSTRTFLKVQKSGSYGRSLDISKFSSYDELRGELARLFGLEGQLEDPQRSGWQLVFVDRENDVLLLGDDPWQEFLNNVWYIKILSPLEVQQMGKEGLTPAASVPSQKLSNSTSDGYMNRQDFRNSSNPDGYMSRQDFRNSSNPDGYMNRQDFRNSSNGIAYMGSLDY
ncbi:AUXIN RESPONSE FACTOR 6 [Salix koriyanagi]|uniref:AUXIN RESPONSE FACTOR 6 n=1 Tax=Salix koriyanagi TaxID=2511006 RepID=A0A9Q0QLR3_9ROSI|nr:AUXIN RESPONSE FACTOR 6 [Salix koriyanagi]